MYDPFLRRYYTKKATSKSTKLAHYECLSYMSYMCVYTDDGWLQVDEDGPGDMLPSSGLTEEGVEGVVPPADGLVAGHLAVGLDAVLQTIQLPAGIAYLGPGLADMDGDAFTLCGERWSQTLKLKTINDQEHKKTWRKGLSRQLESYLTFMPMLLASWQNRPLGLLLYYL